MRVVIRADAGPKIGAGHVARCLALTEALKARGAEVAFAMRNGSAAFVPQFEKSGAPTIDLPEAGDDADAVASAIQTTSDVLVVDHYGWSDVQERKLRDRFRVIAVIDDLADRRHDADILVDATPSRKAADYSGSVPEHCRLLLGTEYALLRGEFSKARGQSLARRNNALRLRRILVSFGGVDSKNMTSVALDGIAGSGVLAKIDVVMGAGAPHLEHVRSKIFGYHDRGMDIALRVGVDDMAQLMTDADLSLGAAGGTALERCALGLPAIAIALADNQEGTAKALARAGAIDYLGRHDQVDAARVAAAVSGISAYLDKLRRMSRVAAGICDGKGAARVAEILIDRAS